MLISSLNIILLLIIFFQLKYDPLNSAEDFDFPHHWYWFTVFKNKTPKVYLLHQLNWDPFWRYVCSCLEMLSTFLALVQIKCDPPMPQSRGNLGGGARMQSPPIPHSALPQFCRNRTKIYRLKGISLLLLYLAPLPPNFQTFLRSWLQWKNLSLLTCVSLLFLCWMIRKSGSLQKWYFVLKIVLKYSEKKIF